jgi:hypothetical protein
MSFATIWCDVCAIQVWEYLPDYQPKKKTKMVDLYQYEAIVQKDGVVEIHTTRHTSQNPSELDTGWEWKMVEGSKRTVEVEDV